MADDVAISAGSGTNIATDDCTSGHVQLVKIAYSADGNRTHATVDADGVLVNLGANNDVTVTGSVTANAGTNLNTSALALESGGNLAGAATSLALLDDAVFADDAAFTVGTSKVVASGIQAVAHGSTPDVADALDAVIPLANRHRIPFILGGHPNLQSSEYFTSGAQTDDPILPVISAGTIYVITGITVTCSAANATTPSVRIGFGTASVPTQGASGADGVAKVLLSHPGIAAGSGIVKGHAGGIVGIGGDGEDLRITCTTPTTSLIVQVDWFTITS